MTWILSLLMAGQIGPWNPALLSNTHVGPSGPVPFYTQGSETGSTPAGWTPEVGSVDWGYSTAGIDMQGTYCVELDAGDSTTFDFTDRDEFTVKYRWRMQGLPGSTGYFIRLAANGSTSYNYSFYCNSGSGTVQTVCGGTSAATSGLSINQTYYVKVHAKKGTGSNAVLSVEVSTTGVFDDVDDEWYAETTNGTRTTQIGRLTLAPGTGSHSVMFDEFQFFDGWVAN